MIKTITIDRTPTDSRLCIERVACGDQKPLMLLMDIDHASAEEAYTFFRDVIKQQEASNDK